MSGIFGPTKHAAHRVTGRIPMPSEMDPDTVEAILIDGRLIFSGRSLARKTPVVEHHQRIIPVIPVHDKTTARKHGPGGP